MGALTTVKATGFVYVQARRHGTTNRVNGLRVARVTQSRQALNPDEECFEVEFELPADYFDTLSPKIVIQAEPEPVRPVTVAKVKKGRKPSAGVSVAWQDPDNVGEGG